MQLPILLRCAPFLFALLAASACPARAQAIGALQGTAHRSPLADTRVDAIAGIVTAVSPDGFWMQDTGDGNPLTSDAIYVFQGRRPGKPQVGDSVLVSGQVQEHRPGGAGGMHNLSTTQIHAGTVSGRWQRVSARNPLPAPVTIGPGFLPPTAIAPAVGNIETHPGYRLQPQRYAIDFLEALEGMRVALPSALAVGPRNRFGEIPVVATAQIGMTGIVEAPGGGVVVGPGRFNGHRIVLDDRLAATPAVHRGARIEGVVGVLDYSHGHFKLLPIQAATVVSNPLRRAAATIAPGHTGIASYNVGNLGGSDARARIAAVAGQIVYGLGAPPLIALQEILDDDGTANSGEVSARATLQRLCVELAALTGRDHGFVAVDPIDQADGGVPGGNIRQAFVYDTARVGFAGPVGGALDAVQVGTGSDGQLRLSLGAGRIAPGDPAFTRGRKPLVAAFTIDGWPVLVINVHFNSKGPDQPLFGPVQPPTLHSARQRRAQADVVGRFATSVLAIAPDANIVVAGDFNDFAFADTLAPLRAAGLHNLTEQLPEHGRYSYNHDGNLQALDHMFVSPHLLARAAPRYTIVHTNADFSDAVSDHDPILLTFTLPVRPGPADRALPPAGRGQAPAPVRRRQDRRRNHSGRPAGCGGGHHAPRADTVVIAPAATGRAAQRPAATSCRARVSTTRQRAARATARSATPRSGDLRRTA